MLLRSRAGLSLGASLSEPFPGLPGFKMRINDTVRDTVAFFGYEDPSKPGGIACIGTGFLLHYKGGGYLVTARHLTDSLGSDPFILRFNMKAGGAANLLADDVKWFNHPDPLVDISAMPAVIDGKGPMECCYVNGDTELLSPELMKHWNVGIGDTTYTVGLFSLLYGQHRNIPIVHTGSIAMMPGSERIPIRDWRDQTGKKRIDVEGYLVNSQSLGGLSGSPVFARPGILLDFSQNPKLLIKKAIIPHDMTFLLGVWQGAWNAPPDQIQGAGLGPVTVPVGTGIVVPSSKIIELLELPEVIAERTKGPAPELQAVKRPTNKPRVNPTESQDANPRHKEDFTSLLDAAAKKKPQGD